MKKRIESLIDSMKKEKLESNIVFRIIKVSYVLGLLFGLFLVVAGGWGERPYYSYGTGEYKYGSWWDALLIWTIGIPTVYIILNLMRETLVYIFFGGCFGWGWLLDPLAYLLKERNDEL